MRVRVRIPVSDGYEAFTVWCASVESALGWLTKYEPICEANA